MSNAERLTQCAPADIDFSQSSAPVASGFDDIYFSTDGGLAETRTVFLEACGLPEGWRDRDYYAIGELGFGTGLNFLAAWQLWIESEGREKGRLHFISVEKYPLDQDQLAKALTAWPELSGLSASLVEKWPGRVKGFHHLEFGDVALTLIHDDILEGLSQISGLIDAWFLDGFSPSKNPDMWSAAVMAQLARLSVKGARLGTFTVARAVRDALSTTGFELAKKPGFGRKRDRLEGIYNQGAFRSARPEIKPVIIGGGIAGACIARSFSRRGITACIIDPDDGKAASGNPAAIVKPRLDLQDRPESRFFLSSYLYAMRTYAGTGGTLDTGVTHLCVSEKEAERYQKLLTNAPLPESHMSMAEHKGVMAVDFPKALVISPARVCKTMLTGHVLIEGTAHDLVKKSNEHVVVSKSGKKLASGSHFVWACGFGVRSQPSLAYLPLRYSRGQITQIDDIVDRPRTYGGYVLPLGDKALIGATHKRLDGADPYSARNVDDVENLDKFEDVFGTRPDVIEGSSRSSVRVTTPSTLPMVFGGGEVFGLTGLGSRGFVFAPLLAEAIVACICHEVLPISNKVWARFQAREKAQPENAPEKTSE